MVKFCPMCKKIYPISTTVCPGCHGTNLMRFCQDCKKMLPPGAISCPVCGDTDTTQIKNGGENQSKGGNAKKKKTKIIPIFLALFLLAGAAGGVWWFFFSSVDNVTLRPKKIELLEGETAVIEYEISPKWAVPRDIKWESSNDEIAKVNQEGEVTALKKGTCYITLSMKGLKKSCDITVKKDGIDFAEIYKEIRGEGFYCQLANDESYLMIDTNPENVKEFYWSYYKDTKWTDKEEAEGMEYVLKANEELGLPASLATKMGKTRALDGRQTETYGDIEVSWSYHPNQGLEVLYETKK